MKTMTEILTSIDPGRVGGAAMNMPIYPSVQSFSMSPTVVSVPALSLQSDPTGLLLHLTETIALLQRQIASLAAVVAEPNHGDTVLDRIDQIVGDLANNKVPTKQIDRLDAAVGKAKKDRAISDQFRPR